MEVTSKDARPPIVCSQGPPPPNPLVVERFQSVVSSLFQQRIVRMGGPVDDDMANLIVAQLLFLDSADQVWGGVGGRPGARVGGVRVSVWIRGAEARGAAGPGRAGGG
jgi:hypothetical protein